MMITTHTAFSQRRSFLKMDSPAPGAGTPPLSAMAYTASAFSGCSAVTFEVNQKTRMARPMMMAHTTKIR